MVRSLSGGGDRQDSNDVGFVGDSGRQLSARKSGLLAGKIEGDEKGGVEIIERVRVGSIVNLQSSLNSHVNNPVGVFVLKGNLVTISV